MGKPKKRETNRDSIGLKLQIPSGFGNPSGSSI